MSHLFNHNLKQKIEHNAPLAEKMRPQSLNDYLGQEHLMQGENSLKKIIQTDNLHSMIFWGPPGSGKTTLAKLVATVTNSCFKELSAVASGIKDLREVVELAKENLSYSNQRTVLFIDEIHRWNKSQQDALLPHVESGLLNLIGATTENPSFEVVSPLLSRCRVYVLKNLEKKDLEKLIEKALKDREKGLGQLGLTINKKAKDFLIKQSGGDARVVLNALETSALKFKPEDKQKTIDTQTIEQALQKPVMGHDKQGEEHYNLISALIKSIRGSDADASVYWLARLISGGEDPKFIARRLIILASEDVGNANPAALSVANATFTAVEKVGLPECQLNLSQAVIFLAQSKKSNTCYTALQKALKEVEASQNLPVPLHLRNATTKFNKKLGYGKNYKYPHNEDDSQQNYLPQKIKNKKFI